MIGRTLGHYRIVEKLGEGGMGVVYRAQDLHLDRLVALKVLPPDKLADADPSTRSGSARATSRAERQRRFTQEAKAASALNHPHIITIYDIASDGGIDFIAMEYVAGKTLDQVIPRHGMRLNEALKIAVQMADALAKAHAAGIIHRDLKPGNVMVTDEGQVKVLDFGLAKLTEAVPAGDDEPTRTAKPTTDEGTIVGSVAYMSPEQAQGKKVDARSDIFSFGAVLYEVVTGCRAFQGETRASTLAAVLKDEPKPASQIAVGLPKEVERLIRRCLQKDPAHRVQHMDDLKVALEELKDESDSGALAAVMAPTQTRRWRRWVPVAITGMLALAALAVWLMRRPPPADVKAVRLTSYAGVAETPSFSPDGKKIAFTWNGEKADNFDIYVLQIGSAGPPLRLTTSPSLEAVPAWSPDDRWIAFLREGKETNAIVLIPPLGGQERTLAEMPGISRLSWTPDGKWLAFDPQDSPKGHQSLWAVSPETGERRRLTTFRSQLPMAGKDNPLGDSTPSLSPDGRSLAFAKHVSGGVRELYVLRLTSDLQPEGEPVRITDQRYSDVSGTAWTADGREVIYGGRELLWRIPVSAHQMPKQLPFAFPYAMSPTIARTLPRLVYAWHSYSQSLWRLDMHTGDRRMLIGSNNSIDSAPQYSPDGSRIAFQSNRSGNVEVWTCQANGSNCQQLTSFGGPQCGAPRWSPDGRRIALDSRVEGRSEIYVIAADGGPPQRVTNTPGFQNNIPTWSSDGRWLYFGSNRTGRGEIWKLPVDGGQAVQVTRSGGHVGISSPDGKYLYYHRGGESPGVFRLPAEGGEETRLVAQPVLGWASFAVTTKGVYFVASGSLQFLDTATGKIKRLADVPSSYRNAMCVSPDDRYVVWSQVDREDITDLMLVENFR
jgi:eukaryotic-like serine/threonine-protein kinase